MGLMNAFDSQTEDSSPAIGRNLRSRPLARKKLSEMVEEELEQMIRVVNLAKVNNYRLNAN